jgi:hypothetical protein
MTSKVSHIEKGSGSKQGQSSSTEFKERGLEAAFSINMRIFKSKIVSRFGNRFPYWHFDLNCGCGINEKIGCIGSPIAFLRAAEQVGIQNYFAGFCDINEVFLKSLMNNESVKGNEQCFAFHGENASLVESIPDIIRNKENPSRAIGMVLSDPNGYGVPLDEMAELSVACPGIDFAIHWNSRIRKLYRGKEWEFVDIDEAISMLNKRYWLIREPRGAHQWTALIGRNIKTGDHRTMGYFHLESEKGQDIMNRCKARLQREDAQGVLAI